jgi:hypothetical protein
MQLKTLMELLTQTEPHYIRCIKPNMFKIQRCFDAALVFHQLSYAGMMETIKIRYVSTSTLLLFAHGARSVAYFIVVVVTATSRLVGRTQEIRIPHSRDVREILEKLPHTRQTNTYGADPGRSHGVCRLRRRLQARTLCQPQ